MPCRGTRDGARDDSEEHVATVQDSEINLLQSGDLTWVVFGAEKINKWRQQFSKTGQQPLKPQCFCWIFTWFKQLGCTATFHKEAAVRLLSLAFTLEAATVLKNESLCHKTWGKKTTRWTLRCDESAHAQLLKSMCSPCRMDVPLSIEDISKFGEGSREIFIKSSCYSVITVAVGDRGPTISWTFSSEPKSISFSVVYRESADSHVEHSKVEELFEELMVWWRRARRPGAESLASTLSLSPRVCSPSRCWFLWLAATPIKKRFRDSWKSATPASTHSSLTTPSRGTELLTSLLWYFRLSGRSSRIIEVF